MKRVLSLTLLFAAAAVFIFAQAGFCERRSEKSLFDKYEDKSEIKVYVSDVTDSSGQDIADLKGLKDVFVNALATRLTLNLKIVESLEAADIAVSTDISEFKWTDQNTVDNIVGIIGIALDAAKKEKYGRIEAVITVVDVKKGKKIWFKKEKATITLNQKTEAAGVSMLNEQLAKVFMRDCFSKNH